MTVASLPPLPVRLGVLLLIAVLSGCGSSQTHRLLDAYAAEADSAATRHRIMIATTRAPSDDPAEVYGRERGALGFAHADITVPEAHETGRIERPKGGKNDPEKHFAVAEAARFSSSEDFSQALRGQLAQSNGRALVFIHGYHTHFDDAVYRTTQVVHDSGYTGTPVLFSWASAGRTVDYIYDNNSATIGRDGLEETLRLLARSGAKRIDIVAHSMGNWVLMEALRSLAIHPDRDISDVLGDVLLAAPDLDVDVFKSQLQRIGKPDRPFFVLLSGDDRALQLSSIIAGNRPRLGDYAEAEDLAGLGIIVVNVSSLSAGGRLNHAKFADNPLLVKLLGERLRDDQFGADPTDLEDRITRLTQGLGTTVGTAAEIIITTPIEIMSIAIGQ